ncbi:hypothetical protein Agub_g6419, partial [Astrephomene gubernaculifera]
VGICSGLVEGRDVVYRKDLGRRMAYSGRCMRLTKLISDAALGGMVLLGASTVERLQPLPRKDLQGLLVWHKGRFELDNMPAGGGIDSAAEDNGSVLPLYKPRPSLQQRPSFQLPHHQKDLPAAARGVGPQD